MAVDFAELGINNFPSASRKGHGKEAVWLTERAVVMVSANAVFDTGFWK